MAIRVLALLHGREGTNRHSYRPMASIQRAIEVCMPTTIHRWCIWHIMKKIPNKLNGYKRHDEINQDMNHVIWNSYTKDEFDRNYNDFITKYGLEGNKWLSDFHIMISCATKLAIETQFQHVYTHEKFREVQAKFRDKVNCITRSMHSTLGFTTYEVVEQVSYSTFNKFVVTYDAISREVMAEMQEYQERSKGKTLLSHEEATLSDVNDLQSPPCVKTRGRPKNRLGSNLEKDLKFHEEKEKDSSKRVEPFRRQIIDSVKF
ncbi:hypothetical protein Ahy_A01g004443 [Arachis hypogaea]|uniref:Protein FAR1-RELATED SEQUENCE n=1 Tax=Arachis hypogaea TaxID=3818 RepID=A0A445EW41_ARAHY|nr:hypothetical protein Ahy_A01g004443 [Arachis hypogaea]